MSEPLAEVVDVEETRNLPAVVAHEAMVTRAEVTPEEVLEQRDKVKAVMSTVMVKDHHYGLIPGVNKPTLLKAGAEVLAVTFRLAPTYKSERTFHDDGHLTVVTNCALQHIATGLLIAEGEGLCTSREKKYAKRKADRVCPSCGVPAIIKGKAEYGGGWLCWKKRDGCGAKFSNGDASIESQEAGDVENPDLADTFNTVLKMANKRALIAAILNGTAASDIFTQDVEDSAPDNAPAQQEERPVEKEQVTVPRTWEAIIERFKELLGEHEAMEWLTQAKELKEMSAITPQPTLLQRLAGAVVDLTESGVDFQITHGARTAVRAILAKHLDGCLLDGPEWCLDGEDPDELLRPSREEVLSRSAG